MIEMRWFDHFMRVSSDEMRWFDHFMRVFSDEMRSSLANTAGVTSQVVTLLARLPTVRIDGTAFIVFPGSIWVPLVNHN